MLEAFSSSLSAVAYGGCFVVLLVLGFFFLLFFFCTPVPESQCTAGADGWKPSVMPYEDVSLSDDALPSVLCEFLSAASSVMGRGDSSIQKASFLFLF